MSTVTVEISESSLKALRVLAESEKVSDSELAGRVLRDFLSSHPVMSSSDEDEEDRKALDGAFGLWADRGEDGLAYQLRMRAEWPD